MPLQRSFPALRFPLPATTVTSTAPTTASCQSTRTDGTARPWRTFSPCRSTWAGRPTASARAPATRTSPDAPARRNGKSSKAPRMPLSLCSCGTGPRRCASKHAAPHPGDLQNITRWTEWCSAQTAVRSCSTSGSTARDNNQRRSVFSAPLT